MSLPLCPTYPVTLPLSTPKEMERWLPEKPLLLRLLNLRCLREDFLLLTVPLTKHLIVVMTVLPPLFRRTLFRSTELRFLRVGPVSMNPLPRGPPRPTSTGSGWEVVHLVMFPSFSYRRFPDCVRYIHCTQHNE